MQDVALEVRRGAPQPASKREEHAYHVLSYVCSRGYYRHRFKSGAMQVARVDHRRVAVRLLAPSLTEQRVRGVVTAGGVRRPSGRLRQAHRGADGARHGG
jgi:hypothetical protein